jgi:hypothetical protein
MKKKSSVSKKNLENLEIQQDEPSYDKLKVFEGQFYKGMKVGGRHKWYYHEGEWKEQKRTPDLWQFSYTVKKRRAGKAPEGSGVPVGTEYHWAILASQTVRKVDANTYETEMKGLKYKVAYKKADKSAWSSGVKGQRKRLIGFLQSILSYLEKEELEAGPQKKITKKGHNKKENLSNSNALVKEKKAKAKKNKAHDSQK